MAQGRCRYCGQPTPVDAKFCPTCGRWTGLAPGLPSWPENVAVDPGRFRQEDRKGLSYIRNAYLLALLAGIPGVVFLLAYPVSQIIQTPVVNDQTQLYLHLPVALLLLLELGLAVWLGNFVLVRQGFATLARPDDRFRWPAIFAVVAAVGVALLAAAGAWVFRDLETAISCSGAGQPLTSQCVRASGVADPLVLILVALALLLLGIVGILVGIWRVGSRFGSGWFKAGAVVLLLLGPLSFVGAILIIVAATRELRRR